MPDACMQSTNFSALDAASYGEPYGKIVDYDYEIKSGISENCLTLAIWAPKTCAEKLPVVIWIHGGGLGSGGISVPYQNPANWVERTQAHIVVSIQYRLGVFGFPNATALASLPSQNFGFLDQRLAVEWVHDNIAAFGGDCNRITLWGQSAGSSSTDAYRFAYPQDDIIKGFIMDSGVSSLNQAVGATTALNFEDLALGLDCSGSDAALLECLRALTPGTIQNYADQNSFAAQPLIDNLTLFANTTERALAGQVAQRPAIFGTNLNEPVSEFGCSIITTLKAQTEVHFPSYFYQYRGNFSNISPNPADGAYHSAELPMLFGAYAIVNGSQTTAFEITTSETMQDLWLAFIRDPWHGLSGLGWQQFNDGYIDNRSVPLASVATFDSCA